jgi:hypothetical protein
MWRADCAFWELIASEIVHSLTNICPTSIQSLKFSTI